MQLSDLFLSNLSSDVTTELGGDFSGNSDLVQRTAITVYVTRRSYVSILIVVYNTSIIKLTDWYAYISMTDFDLFYLINPLSDSS